MRDAISHYLPIEPFGVEGMVDCFMNNPDSDPEENFFEFNKHDLTDGYRKSSLPGLLFKVMNTLHLFGGGILQYEGHVFYYSHISYKERKNTATNLDEELDYFMFPYEGIILHDDNLNLIPIKLSDLKYWKIVSKEYGNLTFELAVKAPLLLDMKEHLVSNEYCISYLTVLICSPVAGSFPSATSCSFTSSNSRTSTIVPGRNSVSPFSSILIFFSI